jgi:hypothetical protein
LNADARHELVFPQIQRGATGMYDFHSDLHLATAWSPHNSKSKKRPLGSRRSGAPTCVDTLHQGEARRHALLRRQYGVLARLRVQRTHGLPCTIYGPTSVPLPSRYSRPFQPLGLAGTAVEN